MKKNTSRISKLILACVPLLLISSTIAHADDTNNGNNITTEAFSGTDDTLTNKDSSTNPLPVSLENDKINTTLNETGAIKLAQYRGVVLDGEFVPKQYEYISIDAKGTFTANKVGDESITIEFKPSTSTLEELKNKFPTDTFSDVFRSISIDVSVTDPNSTSETESVTRSTETNTSSSTGETTVPSISSSPDKKENNGDVKIPLVLTEKILKATEGTLEVKIENGEKVTGSFTKIDSDTFVLDAKGKYTIPEKAQEQKLEQTVTFTLDDDSINTLAKEEAYKDKNIETTYTFDVSREAQKNIVLNFKNKNISTTVGGIGRLAIADYEGLEIAGEFTPLTNNEFLSIDKLGNWKALKASTSPITPTFTVDDTTLKALQAKYPDVELNITTEPIQVTIKDSASSTTNKNSSTSSNLPKTGEEKLRFAGIIGVVLIILVGILFLLKRSKKK